MFSLNKNYKELYKTFAVRFIVFVVVLVTASLIFTAIEKGNYTVAPFSKVDIIRNFSAKHNISFEEIDGLINIVNSDLWPDATEDMTFQQALVMTMSLFYTIGWGHVLPVTTGGRLFAVMISCIGIPLTFTMILSASRIIAKHAFDFVSVLQRKRQTDYEHTKVSTIAYLAFMVGLFLFFYLIGSVLIMKIDEFSYGDALYYSFITLSTIGFGDFYQAEMFENDHLGKQVGMTLFMFFWVLIGLSITASLVIVMASTIKLPTFTKSKVIKKPNNENLIQNDEDQCYI